MGFHTLGYYALTPVVLVPGTREQKQPLSPEPAKLFKLASPKGAIKTYLTPSHLPYKCCFITSSLLSPCPVVQLPVWPCLAAFSHLVLYAEKKKSVFHLCECHCVVSLLQKNLISYKNLIKTYEGATFLECKYKFIIYNYEKTYIGFVPYGMHFHCRNNRFSFISQRTIEN